MSSIATAAIDKAALGNAARIIGPVNPVLSAMMFKILGLNCILSALLSKALSTRKLDPARATKSLSLYMHIIWLAREGLSMTQDFVIPMIEGVSMYRPSQHPNQPKEIDIDMATMKVVCWKFKADFLYIFCLFHNFPAVARVTTPPGLKSSRHKSTDKGKGRAVDTSPQPLRESPTLDRSNTFTPGQASASSIQPSHPIEYGMRSSESQNLDFKDYSPSQPPSNPASFLLSLKNYIPQTLLVFQEVNAMAEALLWGSHPIRLSVKLTYAQFLWDCCGAGTVIDGQIEFRGSGSSEEGLGRGRDGRTLARELCWKTVREVYDASEGMDDGMFEDAARLVGVLGRMGKRGSRRGSVGGNIQSPRSANPHTRSQNESVTNTGSPSHFSEENKENLGAYQRNSGAWLGGGGKKGGGGSSNGSGNTEKKGRGYRLGKMINEGKIQEGVERKAQLVPPPTGSLPAVPTRPRTTESLGAKKYGNVHASRLLSNQRTGSMDNMI